MAEPIKVDSHVHLYRTAEAGVADKQAYEIWEYGKKADVCFSDYSGTVKDIVEAMAIAGVSKSVLLCLFMGRRARDSTIAQLPHRLNDAERRKAIGEIDADLANRIKAVNRWGCELARDHPQIVPFITADVTVLSRDEAATHAREMVESHGARGVKLHGAMQGFSMSDERLWPLYAACQELGVPVVGHSGPDREGAGFAEPRAFGEMLRAFPRLRVVLAHVGGATWQQALEIAELYPNAYFDCCEVIEWTGAPNAPSVNELGWLIKNIGANRVMMGSDFPWYDLDHTVERVMELPLLSIEEKEGILGANAVRILNL
jgi:predicted TIM-barrel fold metal-dependent hydrolase